MKIISLLSFLLLTLISCNETTTLVKTGEMSVYMNTENRLFVENSGFTVAIVHPVRVEINFNGSDTTIYLNYSKTDISNRGFTGYCSVKLDSAIIQFKDVWSESGKSIEINREVEVEGNSSGSSFMSAIEFEIKGSTRESSSYFIPGMVYGSSSNLTAEAIGGESVYTKGEGKVWIREDRMPVPMMAFMFGDGTSFSLVNSNPDGRTTLNDATPVDATTIVDEGLKFGSFFAEQKGDMLITGYAFPGTEGEYTYKGNTYPGGQLHEWRKRYHPLKNGLTQHYSVTINVDNYPDFQRFYTAEWQHAYAILKPEVNKQDIELVRRTMLSIIPGLMIKSNGKAALSNWYDSTDSTDKVIDDKAVFGFTGKNIEMAWMLLYNSAKYPDEQSEIYRKTAYEIISSFLDIKVNPPAGEGYYFKTGDPALAIPSHKCIYLRSYGDAMKVLAKAYLFEKDNGRIHDDWLQWMTTFGNWVLTQQYENGGFPRSWEPATGKILSKSAASSYNIIPFLCEMYKITGENRWLAAALKTGLFSWNSGHDKGRFVGGTIDNPDVLDKEAGTLSLEAYLALFETTKNIKWLKRAEVAARYAATWIYLWNVPMVRSDSSKEWADGVSTVGVQLISTGHSLVDNYMSFDVDEYAKLYKYTGKQLYLEIAKLLLHNTKGMVALPGRKYGYRAPGWVQEHWSLAPPRGKALHPGWLPWVTTSNITGICETEMFDEELFEELKMESSQESY